MRVGHGKHGRTRVRRLCSKSGWPQAARGAGIKGAYSRLYCGHGSLRACRAQLVKSLRKALSVSPKQVYGNGMCSSNPQPSCYDQNQSVGASAITIPPFPFQNRPTFQQVVTLTRKLPR